MFLNYAREITCMNTMEISKELYNFPKLFLSTEAIIITVIPMDKDNF